MKDISSWSGAMLGLMAFVFIGLVPAILYGGWTGLILSGSAFGHPVVMNTLNKIIVGIGALLGVVAVGSLFTVIGAALGTIVGSAVSVIIDGIRIQRTECQSRK